MTQQLYHELLLDHYRNPRNCGSLPGYTVTQAMVHPSCGDRIVIQARVKENRLEKVMFEGVGCIISQAAASLLTEAVQGVLVSEVMRWNGIHMQQLMNLELGPTRMRCALLALESLQKALLSTGV